MLCKGLRPYLYLKKCVCEFEKVIAPVMFLLRDKEIVNHLLVKQIESREGN